MMSPGVSAPRIIDYLETHTQWENPLKTVPMVVKLGIFLAAWLFLFSSHILTLVLQVSFDDSLN